MLYTCIIYYAYFCYLFIICEELLNVNKINIMYLQVQLIRYQK